MDDQINGKRREVGRGVRGMSRQADLPPVDKDERESLMLLRGDLNFSMGGRAPAETGEVEAWLLLPCPGPK